MKLPLATLERIMRNAGAKKLTEDAVKRLNIEVEELADEIAREAIEVCNADGRKKLSLEDIREASE